MANSSCSARITDIPVDNPSLSFKKCYDVSLVSFFSLIYTLKILINKICKNTVMDLKLAYIWKDKPINILVLQSILRMKF